MNKYYTVNFAQAYGESTYGACTYNDSTSCQTSGGGTGTGTGSGTGAGTGSGANASGGLANTGLMIAAFVTLACLIVFVTLIVRFWRRPAKKLAPETVSEASQDKRQE